MCAGPQGFLGYTRAVGVHRDCDLWTACGGQPGNHRDYAPQFFFDGDNVRTGTGALSPDIEDVGAIVRHLVSLLDGGLDIFAQSITGE